VDCTLPVFQPLGQRDHYIEIFNRTVTPFAYTISSTAPWIQISRTNRIIDKEELVWIGIDWQKAPAGKGQGNIIIHGPDNRELSVKVKTDRPNIRMQGRSNSFIETEGYVAMEADHYTNQVASGDFHWLTIPGLGRTGSGVEATPVTTPSITSPTTPGDKNPRLEYGVYLSDTGLLKVQTWFSPILEFNRKAIRYGISFDDEQPQIVDCSKDNEARGAWDKMVADNICIKETSHRINRPGYHVLKFWFVDAGPVLQRLVIDAGGVKSSYLGPPESPRNY
jgi:hypothetical protein